MAAELAAAVHEVSAVARGNNLEGIRARGIALREGTRGYERRVRACDRAANLHSTPPAPAALTALTAVSARLAARKGLYSPV